MLNVVFALICQPFVGNDAEYAAVSQNLPAISLLLTSHYHNEMHNSIVKSSRKYKRRERGSQYAKHAVTRNSSGVGNESNASVHDLRCLWVD